MSKKNVFSNIPTAQKNALKPTLVNQASRESTVIPFSPLDEGEQESLKRLLLDNVNSPDRDLESDVFEVSRITSEIKSIGRQAVFLLGERISQAQKILKSYKDGTFTQWLLQAFGSRQTGYNYLSYFELYQSLPSPDLQDSFSKIPQKAAYTLANKSSGGSLDKTIEIINEYHDRSIEEIIQAVQEAFPLKKDDKRKTVKKAKDAELLKEIVPKIRRLKERRSLQKIFTLVEKLLEDTPVVEEDPNQMDWLAEVPHTD